MLSALTARPPSSSQEQHSHKRHKAREINNEKENNATIIILSVDYNIRSHYNDYFINCLGPLVLMAAINNNLFKNDPY
jgi:hypothetical protein